MKTTITFFDDAIGVQDYDFFPSSVYSKNSMKRIKAEKIEEIDLAGAPPTLKIGDELVFVSAEYRSELESFAKRNEIEVRERFDIWDAILEPFIDTEFAPENARQNKQDLERYGLGEDLVQTWRSRVKEIMITYNFGTGLWDWVHLGLWDLLMAYKLGIGEILTTEEYAKLYKESMKVALLAYV